MFTKTDTNVCQGLHTTPQYGYSGNSPAYMTWFHCSASLDGPGAYTRAKLSQSELLPTWWGFRFRGSLNRIKINIAEGTCISSYKLGSRERQSAE